MKALSDLSYGKTAQKLREVTAMTAGKLAKNKGFYKRKNNSVITKLTRSVRQQSG